MAPTASNTPPLTRSAKKAMLNAKQTKAFEQLDKMMEEILEHDIPGMCTFKFGPPIKAPTTSRSDGHICGAATNNRLASSPSLDQNYNLTVRTLYKIEIKSPDQHKQYQAAKALARKLINAAVAPLSSEMRTTKTHRIRITAAIGCTRMLAIYFKYCRNTNTYAN